MKKIKVVVGTLNEKGNMEAPICSETLNKSSVKRYWEELKRNGLVTKRFGTIRRAK